MKLKKLILSGFKSFADHTEFDFDDGVSCIVGPNGCGKSNIVDAVKWTLGEQSAKSLRGSEMMDVIFNGSASRKPAGHAEVTLVFDNSGRLLQPNIDSDAASNGSISVTRRLFRSGQSEYLINKTPCRLKDIREMFMDTGMGHHAYSLIEQGRVEAFLQASQDDRRVIFDEAAGISKYKARKKEALRKLERVEQNLLRLNDILGEVAKRLRSIKYQAGKARNYQTYTQRLKELRSLHLLANYHVLSRTRAELQSKLDAQTDVLSSITARIDQLEAARSATEVETVDLERTSRDIQTRSAAAAGEITTCEQRADMLAARVEELGEQIVVTAARCEALEAKIEQCLGEIKSRENELSQIDSAAGGLMNKYQDLSSQHQQTEQAITQLTTRLEDEKAGTIDLLRRTAQLHNEINSHNIRRENLHNQKTRLGERTEKLDANLTQLLADRGQAQVKLSEVQEVLSASQAKLEEINLSSQSMTEQARQLQRDCAYAREQRSGLISRSEALREMQERLEGVNAGVRQLLQARSEGKLPMIRGMLGDFLQTDTAHAPVVEAALGGADQQLLADRYKDIEAAAGDITAILGDSGSVEVLCLDRLKTSHSDFDIHNIPQALGRVMDWVRFDDYLSPLMWRLLGRTIAVETLTDAAAAAACAPEGYRFVTRSGEVLEADGRIRLGAANRAAGMITRRSELVELAGQEKQLTEQIEQLQQELDRVGGEQEHLDQLKHKLRTAIYEANTERVECESRLNQFNEQIDHLEQEKPLIAQDIHNLACEIEAAIQAEHKAKAQADELEQRNADRQHELENLNAELTGTRNRQEQLGRQMTELKVALAQAEQKKLAVLEAMEALRRQMEQMQADLQAGRKQIDDDRRRREEAEASITAARNQVDKLFEQQQKLNQDAEDLDESRRGLQEKLDHIRDELTEQRKAHNEASEKTNDCKVELSETDVRIESLISRAAEEMNMDLVALFNGYEHDEHRDWDEVAEEINNLRGKIERLGNVNLDAISEQDELEERHKFLTAQLEDVQSSRDQLNELIRRINKESRDMFLETFEAIRKNFQELFRKLFGGGKADILLLDEENVLESGIEIFARPPGKQLRSLSLLSGGEKTMTALALLFSIFRAKPSPFCLLDEVDAALDETNTERFSHLLREFVANSQFVVISHAKRTMSMANVLYGVTMQQPGISKRISVRFEDAGHKLDKQLEPVVA